MRAAAATLLVFGSGFAVMVLEIIGARYLAKDFGGSFYVWTSQIGVILIALAAGYYLGGALADRGTGPRVLGFLLLPAGLLTALIPNYAGTLLTAIVARHPADAEIPLVWQKLDPAIGSAVIFLLPCVALAAAPPFMIRWNTRQLSQVGRVSGLIIAASTVGSIAGVFVSGYVLIDVMSLSNIFRVTGSLITLLGAACWLGSRRAAKGVGGLAAWTLLLSATVPSPVRAAVVFEVTSPYHHIQVIDEQGVRTLSFDGTRETRMSLADPLKGHFEYTEYFHMPWLWNPAMNQVLMIGLGGGSTQRAYQHDYPKVTVDTVDIDPKVIEVASNYFHLKTSPTLRVHQADGRVFLRRGSGPYQAIIMDAYTRNRYGSFIPYHLVTKEFFELARERLTPDGVLAYNVITDFQGWRSAMLGTVYATLKAVFPEVYTFPAKESQNVVLIATRSAEKITGPLLLQRAADLVQNGTVTLPTFLLRLQSLRTNAPPGAAGAQVLTDDFAPVDGLLRPGAGLPRNVPSGVRLQQIEKKP